MCRMTEMSGADDRSDFDGNAISVGSDDDKYRFLSSFQIIKLFTEDKIIDFISVMGNNMISTAMTVGEKYTYFLSAHYEFIKNEKIEEGTSLNSTNDSFDPYDYHVLKFGENMF